MEEGSMFTRVRALSGALGIFVLTVGAASATTAISSADMTAHEGPGDEYKTLWVVSAGSRVDIRECNPFQWCFVIQQDKQGWVHVDRVEGPHGQDASGPVSASADATTGGSGGGAAGSKTRPGDTRTTRTFAGGGSSSSSGGGSDGDRSAPFSGTVDVSPPSGPSLTLKH
jgi:uncharacterized protein YraI